MVKKGCEEESSNASWNYVWTLTFTNIFAYFSCDSWRFYTVLSGQSLSCCNADLSFILKVIDEAVLILFPGLTRFTTIASTYVGQQPYTASGRCKHSQTSFPRGSRSVLAALGTIFQSTALLGFALHYFRIHSTFRFRIANGALCACDS